MAESYRYFVRKKFKYGDKQYLPKMEFVPEGGKFDEQILDSDLVYRERVTDKPARRRARKGKTP